MAVELKDLYAEIKPQYEVRLHTKSCFQKRIGWIHMVESGEFAKSLYGDELVFNSGLNYVSESWLKDFVAVLNRVHAGGAVVALRDGNTFSQEISSRCFPPLGTRPIWISCVCFQRYFFEMNKEILTWLQH